MRDSWWALGGFSLEVGGIGGVRAAGVFGMDPFVKSAVWKQALIPGCRKRGSCRSTWADLLGTTQRAEHLSLFFVCVVYVCSFCPFADLDRAIWCASGRVALASQVCFAGVPPVFAKRGAGLRRSSPMPSPCRSVMAMRFMNGLSSIMNALGSPSALKIIVETLGFQHLDLAPRLIRCTRAPKTVLAIAAGST